MAIKKQDNTLSYSKLVDVMDIPFLLHTQKASYEDFLKRGIKKVFKGIFPIKSFDESLVLDLVDFYFEHSKYNVEECHRRGMTYAAPLKINLRLNNKGEICEQVIYLADIPLITDNASFVINGAERVVVSQLQRSPGVSFEKKMQPNEKRVFVALIIPYRGAWLEFEFDEYDRLYVYIDRRKKMMGTSFFRALGYETDEDILKLFYKTEVIDISKIDDLSSLVGRRLLSPIYDLESGEILVVALDPISSSDAQLLVEKKIKTVELIRTEGDISIILTLQKDPNKTMEESLLDLFKKVRPGDPATFENAKNLVDRLFFDPKRYDLAQVGRFKLNKKLGLSTPETQTLLQKEDLIKTMLHLIEVKNGHKEPDDIDHLGNRRVITVGELVSNQFRIGFMRLERSVKEKMSLQMSDKIVPHNLLNAKLVSSAIKDFFQRSQLSQFMDQVNPLAELTHKRRLSALGPGGLSRDRAGFEVRDVHYSHYGRICPIETPEGPNIGLISSLGTYAHVNKYGFLETPYRRVEKGVVLDKIDYLSADEEDCFTIAQANAPVDEHGVFQEKQVACRFMDDYPVVDPEKVDYMDVSPKQLVSLATSLIPFLEHDDANRALMGSNMQRQAVPLLQTEEPCVATGMEGKVAVDSGALILSKYAGEVVDVDASTIVVLGKMGKETYHLRKFDRSNAGTCINQRVLVHKGDKVKKREILADGFATDNGRLALGRNVNVAFMSWGGYNFEDAILLSESLVKEDKYTSIHIEEFSVEARDIKLGEEEITSDLPNVNEELLKDLGSDGVVRIGAEVKTGSILVGKLTPKSETELSPEEKLLRAIFGEKAGEARDTSLVVPSGVEGIVLDTKVFSRKEKDVSDEDKSNEKEMIKRVKKYYDEAIIDLENFTQKNLKNLVLGESFDQDIFHEDNAEILIKKNESIQKKHFPYFLYMDLEKATIVGKEDLTNEVNIFVSIQKQHLEELREQKKREINRIFRGDELPPGVIKLVKVYIVCRRSISVGDKMAGRHGNKGVVAKILPEEDMPFLPDGTPVEVVLNPLGVPSRMNLGQLLETHLGLASKTLNCVVQTPVFDSTSEANIEELLEKASCSNPDKNYINKTGRVYLYDGRTGERFDQKVTVGYMYILKLAHLVDDKLHARAIGPYSLVTQQPLGGKAQFGGQRFGEMEVWALEAYGAAYTLQEMLTVKSDDVAGRTTMYESIVKGDNSLKSGIPESFNVLIKELQSLALCARPMRKEDLEDGGIEE